MICEHQRLINRNACLCRLFLGGGGASLSWELGKYGGEGARGGGG